ncbi:TPA: hypothetical protein ACX3LO_004951 [Raoultella ornithinolytica]
MSEFLWDSAGTLSERRKRLKIYGVTVAHMAELSKTVSKLAHARIVTAALSQKEPTNDQQINQRAHRRY